MSHILDMEKNMDLGEFLDVLKVADGSFSVKGGVVSFEGGSTFDVFKEGTPVVVTQMAGETLTGVISNVPMTRIHAEYAESDPDFWETGDSKMIGLGYGLISTSPAEVADFVRKLNDSAGRSVVEERSLEYRRAAIADEIFESYAFGEGVSVVASNGWDASDLDDYVKVAYLEYDDDLPEADSHKASFHVRFGKDGSVEDAYALEMEHGNDIGSRGDSY